LSVRRERVSSRYALAWITVASFVAFAINVTFSATAVFVSVIVAFTVIV
jgi:4-hydroxybenzoate polyprenyltransferase